jgi:hypothetical protein
MIVEPRQRAIDPPRYSARHAAPRPAAKRRRWPFILGVAACAAAGMAAIVKSYLIAQTTLSNEAEFIWFWAGLSVMEIPLIVVIARRRTGAAARSALLLVIAFASYAPKLLRDPGAPAYHDEYAHWRATHDIIASHQLFQPAQIVPIIGGYPGLHAATAVIVDITGLSIWQAATILLLLCHVALLAGIVTLARTIGLDSRTATLAAVVYGFNASFLYFDTQFAYESMAMTLVVWSLAAFTQAIRAQPGPHRSAWRCLTVMLSFGCAITHHLTTIELTLVMLTVSVALSLPRAARSDGWQDTARTAWSLTAFTLVAITCWITGVAPGTMAYLSPYLGAGLSQLVQMLSGSSSGRQLFSASLSPWWEHAAAFGVTLVALVFAAAGLLLLRQRWRDGRLAAGRERALLLAYTVVGLVYFPSTVFIFSPSGAEGARRSWAVSWVGLSMLTALAAAWLIDWASLRRRAAARWAALGMLIVMTATALVGGTAAGLDASYRFPGPYLFGSDARSDTPELDAMAQWFLARFGQGHRLITDRFTGLLMASSGLQDTAVPSAAFPVWDLYIAQPGRPLGPPFLFTELSNGHYRYLVVDKRMATDAPQLGIYFEGNEPRDFVLPNGQPIFSGRLAKFNGILWMSKIFESDNYAVYRMNLPASSQRYQALPAPLRGKLTVR